jgi:hypothetical protein
MIRTRRNTQTTIIVDNTVDDHLRGEFAGELYMTEAGRSNRLRSDSSSR